MRKCTQIMWSLTKKPKPDHPYEKWAHSKPITKSLCVYVSSRFFHVCVSMCCCCFQFSYVNKLSEHFPKIDTLDFNFQESASSRERANTVKAKISQTMKGELMIYEN